MTILVTGAKGMIGTQLIQKLLSVGHVVVGVDRIENDTYCNNYFYYKNDLTDKNRIRKIVNSNKVDRIIHLAALAHVDGETDLSWERYKRINVDCAKNVFEAAEDRPVLFVSTVDVFGFSKKAVHIGSATKPVSFYAKSKKMAEDECMKLRHYTIFRFSPVYTESIKRDIQKRYYIKYPNIAYQIGSGTEYEILDVRKAVQAMTDWCMEKPKNDIKIIKDDKTMWTPDYIKAERAAGRAKIVLHFPKWMVNFSYIILKRLFGENEKTYLLNKVVHPLKTE